MTLLSTVLLFFPALVMALGAIGLLLAVVFQNLWGLLLAVGAFYLLPLLAYRVHASLFPIPEGPSHLEGGAYSPWWGSHQIQLIYIAIPQLEELLRLVPGVFSMWLRAFGSTIGSKVYWTPRLHLGDRGLVEVGDGVIIGYDAGISSHLIKRTRKNVLLYVKRVRIEDGAFIGAGARIGPGVVVEAGAQVEAGEGLYPNTRVSKERRAPRSDRAQRERPPPSEDRSVGGGA